MIIYLGMNPEMKDNAMGGGRNVLRTFDYLAEKMNIGKVDRMKKYIKY
jgi:hypothetical protein